MKLTYRGQSYDYNPPAVETSDAPSVGKYRGLDVRFRNPVKPAVIPQTLNLKYRGAAYQVGGETAPAEAPAPVTAQASQSEDRARTLMMSHHRNVKRRQQVMLARLANEVGLTADVTKYWNHIQGKVHPSFWATYDRSHATLS
ncbi:MAG: DUF4278 domain-containing protein [Thainema sp.]